MHKEERNYAALTESGSISTGPWMRRSRSGCTQGDTVQLPAVEILAARDPVTSGLICVGSNGWDGASAVPVGAQAAFRSAVRRGRLLSVGG